MFLLCLPILSQRLGIAIGRGSKAAHSLPLHSENCVSNFSGTFRLFCLVSANTFAPYPPAPARSLPPSSLPHSLPPSLTHSLTSFGRTPSLRVLATPSSLPPSRPLSPTPPLRASVARIPRSRSITAAKFYDLSASRCISKRLPGLERISVACVCSPGRQGITDLLLQETSSR